MYDYAGEWAYNVGIPAKSGVGGGIVGALPDVGGIAVFSPRLDQHGNSVHGIKVFEHLSERFDMHLLIPTGPGAGWRASRTAPTTTASVRLDAVPGGEPSMASPDPPRPLGAWRVVTDMGRCAVTAVMNGVRVLEVAEHTFVPAASALLSDWGADVIKIEHVERGDAMRGLASSGVVTLPKDVHALLEHSNRGKRSLALDLTTQEGLDLLYRLAETSDVFLTNKLPGVRAKLHIDVDDIRAHNPNIVYVRGTGQGARGPDADKGSYDSLAFWARSGIALGGRRPEYDLIPVPPAPGFGDSIGAMTIAGGIMGALFHRERTGEATLVDVSLFGVGLWAMGQAMALSLLVEMPWAPPSAEQMGGNPLTRVYLTQDGRHLSFTCLQGGSTGPRCARWWADRSWPPPALRRPCHAHGQQPRRRRVARGGLRRRVPGHVA